MWRFALCALFLATACIVEPMPDEDDNLFAATWGPYDPKPGHPTTDERDAFVAEVSRYAQDAEIAHGTPAAALTAMAANESGFGWTKIALNANNLYGWKWYSAESAGGRDYWVLADQPSWDDNNKYVKFADRRDAVLFIASKLATMSRYRPHTDRYQSDLAAGVDKVEAINRWIWGVAKAGYNPFDHYPNTTIKFMNNYRSPSWTRSPDYDLYRYSPPSGGGGGVWIAVDSPASGAVVSGDVTIATSVGGGTVTSVEFFTRAVGAVDWYSLGAATRPPYTRTWSTDPWVTDGLYEVKVEPYDGATRVASGVIQVRVDNPGP